MSGDNDRYVHENKKKLNYRKDFVECGNVKSKMLRQLMNL